MKAYNIKRMPCPGLILNIINLHLCGSQYKIIVFTQVSISDEHKKLSSGRYEVRLFDEEGYSLLRKAQRSGESVDAIKPVTTISFNHPVSTVVLVLM